MNISFLKPSLRKIVIFIAFLMIGEFLFFSVVKWEYINVNCQAITEPSCLTHKLMWEPCSQCGKMSFFENIRTYATYLFNPWIDSIGSQGIRQILSLIYWYVLACLLGEIKSRKKI